MINAAAPTLGGVPLLTVQEERAKPALGTVAIETDAPAGTEIVAVPAEEAVLPPKEAVEFANVCKTKGGFKVVSNPVEKTAILTPLPDEPATKIALNIPGVTSVKAIGDTGKELRDVPFTLNEGEKYPLVFTTQSGEFAYKIVW